MPKEHLPSKLIKEAQQQRFLKFAMGAALNPMAMLIQQGLVMSVSQGKPVSDQEYIEAIIIDTLEKVGLLNQDAMEIWKKSVHDRRSKQSPTHPMRMPLY